MLEFDMVTTRGGDRGETSLYDGSRHRKDDVVFEAMGDIDELSSHLGVCKASFGRGVPRRRRISQDLTSAQRVLVRIGSMIATPTDSELYGTIETVGKRDVEALEASEHDLFADTEITDRFVLPGATREAALVDVARAVCRRSERRIVTCIRDRHLGHLIPCQHYLNRLSDYLFVLARFLS